MSRARVELADLSMMNEEIRRRSFAYNRERNRRGRNPQNGGGGVAPAVTPLTILGANCIQWCRADQLITLNTGNVSGFGDLSGTGNDYIQGTAAAQPLYTATDATLANLPTLTFDGVDDTMTSASFNLPAPATTPTWIWMVVKQLAWTINKGIVDGFSTTSLLLYQAIATPDIVQFNTANANVNTGPAVGSWVAFNAGFTGSVADFTQVNDVARVSGASAGNSASTGRRLASRNGGVNFVNVALSEIVYANIIPSAGQISQFAAYRLGRYLF